MGKTLKDGTRRHHGEKAEADLWFGLYWVLCGKLKDEATMPADGYTFWVAYDKSSCHMQGIVEKQDGPAVRWIMCSPLTSVVRSGMEGTIGEAKFALKCAFHEAVIERERTLPEPERQDIEWLERTSELILVN